MFQIGLVGASNAGKSTLFNRLIGQFRAIVTDIPGTTRDILLHTTTLEDIGEVIFADSPGLLDFKDERPFIKRIIDDSDLLLFVIDDSAGITTKEENILKYIRESHKQESTILVVNKLDIKRRVTETDLALSEYYKLGLPEMIGISAKGGRNMEILKDMLVKNVYHAKEKNNGKEPDHVEFAAPEGIPIAIIGKPNAGKSTLLNTLTKRDLSKVSAEAGTTRDYVTGVFEFGKKIYTLYDTAGIKKQGSMRGIERIAYQKTLDMLKFVRPVVIFLIDVTVGISHRDMTLIEEIHNLALPIIFALNKTDLLNKKQIDLAISSAKSFMDFAKYIPIFPLSAQKGSGINDLFKLIPDIRKESTKRIDTNELNKIITAEYFERPPRFSQNKLCKILYITQVDINAPTFLAFVNHKTRANFAFKKWIENSIRKHFGFVGTPIVIRFRDKTEKEQEQEKTYGRSKKPWIVADRGDEANDEDEGDDE